MRRGRSCCVSSKWPQACWLQVRAALLSPCPPRGTRRWSQVKLALLSPCPPWGTSRHSQVRLALSWSPSSSFLTGAIIVRHKLVLPTIKPNFVFLFCHHIKVPQFSETFIKKKITYFVCLSSVPVVHLPLTCLRSSGVCHREGLLAVSFFSGWRGWRSARGCFIPLQKLIVASPL